MGGVSVVMMWILIFYLIIASLTMLWGIAAYVMTSLSYHTIAKRRGLNKPWLAWLPIANVWIMGSLSDQYRYVTRGQITNKRKVLLSLEIAVFALLAVMMVLYVLVMVTVVGGSMNGELTDAQSVQLMSQAVGMLGVCFVMMVVTIVYAVFFYIALYDVFRSCDPKNATLYLVLTILLGVVYPFFMLACRNKDLGLPPRTNVDPAASPLE